MATIDDILAELKSLRSDLATLRTDVTTLRDETASGFKAVRSETAAGLEAVRSEMTAGFAAVRGDIASLQHLVKVGFEREVDTRLTQAEIVARLVAVEEKLGIRRAG
jgi:hypothetical protein